MKGVFQKIKSLLQSITIPVALEFNIFLIYFITLIVGGTVYNIIYSDSLRQSCLWTIMELPIFFSFAYFFCLLHYFFKKYIPKLAWISYLILSFYISITLIESFVLINFKSYITPVILTFIFQTNFVETKGFFMAFVCNWTFVAYLGGFAAILACMWAIMRFLSRTIITSKWLKYIVFGGLCSAFALFTVFDLRKIIITRFPYTAVSRVATSLYNYNNILAEDKQICSDSGIIKADINSSVIIVVIGESYNKHHSSLYGYSKLTNPRLEHYLASLNLFAFNDVISPYRHTNEMLKELFSFHSVDSEMKWREFPLWFQVFKESGFHVSFVSNQVTAISDDHWSELGSYFFQYPDVVKRSFDYRNYDLYKYDEGLLSELDLIASKVDSCELTVLQLKGQHIYAKYNFPHDQFTKFTIEDYRAEKNFLNDSQMQEIADYDNATLYNDYVVSEIIKRYQDKDAILIYLSDHGEEVHDYRAFLGRSHNPVPNEHEVKYQYEIPFMIYVSDLYKKNHPEIVDRIKESVNLPFMSDDLSHLILGLSGIKTKWYDPTRDLLHENYNRERRRIVSDNVLYKSN